MAGKAAKKELKQPDLFQLFFRQAINYAAENRSRVYIISGIVALLLLISSGWYVFRLNYEGNARNIYARAYDAQIKEDLKQAIKVYREVTAKYPDSQAATIAYYQLGNLHFRLHEIDASIKAYQETLKKAPKDTDISTLTYEGLGYCYESRKNFEDALKSFEKAVKTDVKGSFEGDNYRNIARIYEQLNKGEKALEYYRKALDKNKDPFVDMLIKKKMSSITD
ncbi:MAG: tetratricopeptide repeat protein [Syntrophales bacterium]